MVVVELLHLLTAVGELRPLHRQRDGLGQSFKRVVEGLVVRVACDEEVVHVRAHEADQVAIVFKDEEAGFELTRSPSLGGRSSKKLLLPSSACILRAVDGGSSSDELSWSYSGWWW